MSNPAPLPEQRPGTVPPDFDPANGCYTCGRRVGTPHSDRCPRRYFGAFVLPAQRSYLWSGQRAPVGILPLPEPRPLTEAERARMFDPAENLKAGLAYIRARYGALPQPWATFASDEYARLSRDTFTMRPRVKRLREQAARRIAWWL